MAPQLGSAQQTSTRWWRCSPAKSCACSTLMPTAVCFMRSHVTPNRSIILQLRTGAAPAGCVCKAVIRPHPPLPGWLILSMGLVSPKCTLVYCNTASQPYLTCRGSLLSTPAASCSPPSQAVPWLHLHSVKHQHKSMMSSTRTQLCPTA